MLDLYPFSVSTDASPDKTPKAKSRGAASSESHKAKVGKKSDIEEKSMNCHFLVIFQGHRGKYDDLDHTVFRRIRQEIRSEITSPREENEIDLWIESPGGDAHAAYKIALLLRE